jgi:vacuolar protein sorting-associated protein 45
MVLVGAVRDYLNRMLTDIPGMKVLILDAQTVGIISVAMSQSELLQKEVFLVEKVDAQSKDAMGHLKAVTFLRPTAENIQHLKRHLTNPKFGEYHLCRCSVIPPGINARDWNVKEMRFSFYTDYVWMLQFFQTF